MAKLRELVTLMSELLGEPRKSVNVRAMVLRKSGLIHSTGRGHNAAEMEPSDASNLLLACLSGAFATEASQATRSLRKASRTSGNAKAELLGLERTPTYFGDALDAVFETTPDKSLEHLLVSIRRNAGFWSPILEWPGKKVKIEFHGERPDPDENADDFETHRRSWRFTAEVIYGPGLVALRKAAAFAVRNEANTHGIAEA